jgi:hypothetical protein
VLEPTIDQKRLDEAWWVGRILEHAPAIGAVSPALIGAFPNEQDARKKLSIAQAKATQILNHASPLTEAVVKGDNTLYRARFAGLQKDEAEVACRQLKSSEIDCIIIKNWKCQGVAPCVEINGVALDQSFDFVVASAAGPKQRSYCLR